VLNLSLVLWPLQQQCLQHSVSSHVLRSFFLGWLVLALSSLFGHVV
jgi:hypothetical protein